MFLPGHGNRGMITVRCRNSELISSHGSLQHHPFLAGGTVAVQHRPFVARGTVAVRLMNGGFELMLKTKKPWSGSSQGQWRWWAHLREVTAFLGSLQHHPLLDDGVVGPHQPAFPPH